MDTLILRPNGAGYQQNWNAEGGDYTRVNEAVADGDTTRLYSPTNNVVATFSMDNRGSAAGPIASVKVVLNIRGVDPVSNSVQPVVRIGGTDYYAPTQTFNSTSYILQSYTWTTNPATSATWTWSDIDALEAGMKRISGGGQAVTQVYVEVSYTATPPATIEQEGYRFRNDDGSESAASWKLSQDTALTIAKSTPLRLRVLLNVTNDPDPKTYQLEYKKSTDSTWTALSTNSLIELVNNNFASNTTEFTSYAGTWGLSSGVLQSTAASGVEWRNRIFLTTVTNFTTFTLLAKVRKPSFNTQIIFRSSSTNGYGLQIRDANVFRLENWGVSNLQQATPISWVTGTWYWVKIQATGNVIKARVWADGSSEPSTWHIDYTDTANSNAGLYTSGGVGFSAESSSGTAEYDDILVTKEGTSISLTPSSFIASSGENTTAQLIPPSGKTTGDFQAGRIQDDENPTDVLDISTGKYTELEWAIIANAIVADGDTYQFRVTDGASFATYTVTPQITIGTGTPTSSIAKIAMIQLTGVKNMVAVPLMNITKVIGIQK